MLQFCIAHIDIQSKKTIPEISFKILVKKCIIGGDLNAKHSNWGSRLITPKGRELYKAAQNYDCEFISTSILAY